MARPVVALLTDFGTRDHYAGTMKAVVLGICPDVTLVDISHDIPPHDVLAAALELSASYRFFPPGTIFLVVVDPGVGSARRGIAADTGEYRFVAPDNGVLTAVFNETAPRRVVELTERRYARPTVSKTFEGRDRFAPAAGWLAKGIELSALGRPAGDCQVIDIPTPEVTAEGITGRVLRVDRFGNLVTNITRKLFEKLAQAGPIQISIGDYRVGRVVATYGEAGPGEICALFGSTDHLEIAANAASASDRLKAARGAAVTVQKQA
jgi:S-adenosyl-L-methionine hydrolase (adenosine-forming)